MSCPLHRHLPSPWQPASCEDCHPRPLSGFMPPGPVGTTSATAELLSDIASTLRQQLRESHEEVRVLSLQAGLLGDEIKGLKRVLAATKRDVRMLCNTIEQERRETQVILEALERATAGQAK